jgi:outer membrane protein TolC
VRKAIFSSRALAMHLVCLVFCVRASMAQPPGGSFVPPDGWRNGAVMTAPDSGRLPQVTELPPPAPNQADHVLPINLPTALCLSQARPLVIAFAQNSVEKAAAQLQAAKALWLPDINIGAGYSHHDGAIQGTFGEVSPADYGSYSLGPGATMNLGVTDAIFRPLAARQELCARRFDLEAAQNDGQLAVAQSYFDVQEARGRLAGVLDSTAKAKELVAQIESLARAIVPEMEADRARALAAQFNVQAAAARGNWQIASSRLTRVLRLAPGSVVAPEEPAYLQVTLIGPEHTVDDLVPCGLTNRPELSSQRAAVQATLELLRAEKMRPLLPSVVLAGNGPDGSTMGGVFGGGTGGDLGSSYGRADVSAGLVWTLQNLGAGNCAAIRGRAADKERATIELAEIEDRIADEVVQAHAAAEAARGEIAAAETALKEARITFDGTMKGLSEVRGAGNLLQTVSRPQEGVAALQQLNQAYADYFTAVNKYNRAQFQLYHAVGYPSRILAWQRQEGDAAPSPPNRPPEEVPPPESASRQPFGGYR